MDVKLMPVTEPFFINNLPKNSNLLEGAGNENVTVAQKLEEYHHTYLYRKCLNMPSLDLFFLMCWTVANPFMRDPGLMIFIIGA